MKPTLNDGWNLTGLDTTIDQKIPETITALVGAAKLGVAPGARARNFSGAITPGLYRLVIGEEPDSLPRLIGPVRFPQTIGLDPNT
jgi:hypothetical protein